MELAFYLSGLVAVLAALRVITHTQPIHALLYLIISIISIACIFFLMGAYFAGAMEIIVYAGAIMVLFVFVVMMLNMSASSNKQERVWLCPRVWIGPSLLALVLQTVLVYALASVSDYTIIGKLITAKTVGTALFGPYVLAVELASMLLLAGLVVACHLGRSERNNVDIFYNGPKMLESLKKGGEKA